MLAFLTYPLALQYLTQLYRNKQTLNNCARLTGLTLKRDKNETTLPFRPFSIFIHKKQHSNPLNPTETVRSLVLEVWYPAAANTVPATSYENEARSGAKFDLLGNASRDVAFKVTDTKYPVVVVSLGYTAYRTIMNRATDQQFALEWLSSSEFAESVDTSKS